MTKVNGLAVKDFVLAEKRKIFGIDPYGYDNREEFYRVVNKKICEVYNKKIENVLRHIEACKEKYKKLLLDSDRYMYQAPVQYEHYEKLKSYYNRDEINASGLSWEEKNSECKKDQIYCNLIDEYLEYMLNRDLDPENGLLSIINKIRKELDPEFKGMLYEEVSGVLFRNRLELPHPFVNMISESRENIPGICPPRGELLGYLYSDEITAGINLLIQMSELKKQLDYYQSIIRDPDRAIFEYLAKNNSWGAIMQYPYWVRLGRDIYPCECHEKMNLFMIKPGTLKFDEDSIRYFVRKRDKKFSDKMDKKCDRLSVTIPSSLEYDSIVKVIEYAHLNAENLNFVCQSDEVANVVKKIIIEKELDARRERGIPLLDTVRRNDAYYINEVCYVNVDPDYYSNFFADTPNNKNFWHRYDYGSCYEHRRKSIIDLKQIIDMCILEYFNTSSDNLSDETKVSSDIIYSSEIEKTLLDRIDIDGRKLSLEDDMVLALVCRNGSMWKKMLPFIGGYTKTLNKYMLTGEGKKKINELKEYILIFKSLFLNNWKVLLYDIEQYQQVYFYAKNDIDFLADSVKFFKFFFPGNWFEKIKNINEYLQIIDDYRKDPTFVEDVITLLKMIYSKKWDSGLSDSYDIICKLYLEDSRPFEAKKYDLIRKHDNYVTPF